MKNPPPSVKLIAAILYREEAHFQNAQEKLEGQFSLIDYISEAFPFIYTDYYQEEMGAGLLRRLISFTKPVEPTFLIEAKWMAHRLEQSLLKNGDRQINVDMGYLDLFKLVLASFKERGNKLYLDQDVWADMTLTYREGRFHPLEWSFPDFKSGAYELSLSSIRTLFKAQLKPVGGGGKSE